MKNLKLIEVLLAGLALVFIVVGAYAIVQPIEMNVSHPGPVRYQSLYRSQTEQVSKNGDRVYGVLAVVVGAGLGWLVLTGKCR